VPVNVNAEAAAIALAGMIVLSRDDGDEDIFTVFTCSHYRFSQYFCFVLFPRKSIVTAAVGFAMMETPISNRQSEKKTMEEQFALALNGEHQSAVNMQHQNPHEQMTFFGKGKQCLSA
jgi:uncharacterized membrane protein